MKLTYLEIDHHRSHYETLPEGARDLFMERLIFSWLYHDHAIEGVVLTPAEIHRALEGQPCRNYCDGLTQQSLRQMKATIEYLYACADRREELSLDWIKDLHAMMCDANDEAAGRYRKRDTSPGVYNLDIVPSGSISYYFHKFMDTFDEELSRYHPIRAAAIAHWEFMRVFPFDERTGLIGRLMMNYLLLREHYPPAIIHATDRHNYFAALNGHRTDLIPVVVDAVRATIEAARAFSQEFVETSEHQLAL